MNRTKIIATLIFTGIVTICSFGVGRTYAYPPFFKQVKELGYDAKDCTYCHEKQSGGKGWNKRGLWLRDQKKERKAQFVDVRWLKSYQPAEETKNDQEAKKEKDAETPKN